MKKFTTCKCIKSARAPQLSDLIDRSFRNLHLKQYKIHTEILNNARLQEVEEENKKYDDLSNNPEKYISKRANQEDYMSLARFHIEWFIRKPGDVLTFGS